jgi:hypothetical protein
VPNVRDDRAIRPLLVGRDSGGSKDDLGWAKTGIFLQAALDRPISDQIGDLPVEQSAYLSDVASDAKGVACALSRRRENASHLRGALH